VSILLSVTRKLRRFPPGCRKEGNGTVRRSGGRVDLGLVRWKMANISERTYFREKLVHFATCTIVYFARISIMPVTQEIIPEERICYECLQYNVEKACLPKVDKTTGFW